MRASGAAGGGMPSLTAAECGLGGGGRLAGDPALANSCAAPEAFASPADAAAGVRGGVAAANLGDAARDALARCSA